VQGEVNRALSIVLREAVETTGAGRTDTGVHASCYVAHFNSHSLQGLAPLAEIAHKLNRILPEDICVHRLQEVAPEANARFDARERTYQYFVRTQKNPFNTAFSTFIPFALDLERMNAAARELFHHTDFTSFAKLHAQTKTNNCRITRAEWTPTGDGLVFTISADRFLRNMVRAIVGTLIDVGRGKLSVDDFRRIIEQKDRCKAGGSVPAQGLWLVDIKY
jgi:tRNA pseudouridine38-40 synthase